MQESDNRYDAETLKNLKAEVMAEVETRRKMGQYYPQERVSRWRDPEEYYDQRMEEKLRGDIRRELLALEKMERRMGSIQDPEMRRTIFEMVDEAREQGVGAADLSRMMSYRDKRASGSGWLGLKGIDRRSFFWGIGAALLAGTVLPTMLGVMRPIAKKAVSGVMDISDRAQGLVEQAKGEIEDIVAEAKFNRFKDSIDQGTVEE